MGYWRGVAKRAFWEARGEVRLDTPVRIVTGVVIPIAAGLIVGLTTGSVAWGSVVSVGLLLLVGACLFIQKLFVVPGRMAAEQKAEIERLTVEEDDAESARRHRLIQRLTQLYILSHDGITPALAAGLEMPPKDWLNEQLGTQGERWSIHEIRGTEYSTFEVVGPA
jgi:hypothetical protein